MLQRNRLIVDAVYALWEAGDLTSAMNCFSDNVVFAVHPVAKATFIGQGHGKAVLARRLADFLSEYDVIDHLTPNIRVRGDWVDYRVRYHYRHKKTGMEIDGRMRHLWHVLDDKVVRFYVIHDAQRMGAFFQMAAQITGVP